MHTIDEDIPSEDATEEIGDGDTDRFAGDASHLIPEEYREFYQWVRSPLSRNWDTGSFVADDDLGTVGGILKLRWIGYEKQRMRHSFVSKEYAKEVTETLAASFISPQTPEVACVLYAADVNVREELKRHDELVRFINQLSRATDRLLKLLEEAPYSAIFAVDGPRMAVAKKTITGELKEGVLLDCRSEARRINNYVRGTSKKVSDSAALAIAFRFARAFNNAANDRGKWTYKSFAALLSYFRRPGWREEGNLDALADKLRKRISRQPDIF